MDPVEYTLNLQRLFVILAGLSFAGGSAMLVFLDPKVNSLYVWGFLGLCLIFLTSLISLLAFWWFFSIRKEILTIVQVNQVVYQSLISASVLVLLLVMQQTGQLNFWSGCLVLIVYMFYELWVNAE
jgi:hypothetical protein